MRIFVFLFMVIFSFGFSQEDNVLERVSALRHNDKVWYNIDGYSVTSEIFNEPFNEKGLKKVFKKHKISNLEATKNNQIKFNNLFATQKKKIIGNKFQTENYYFVENQNKTITLVWFIKNGTTDKATEEVLVSLIIENKIPEEKYVPININSIDFAGRKIELGNNCYWTMLNTVQCPYLGEMNWSIHKTLNDAKESVENQLDITKSRKGGKVISEEIVNVEFEGVPTKAKKVIYSFTGITSVLAGMSGGKSLIIYYVAENIRGKNMSCVMSFWDNDNINPETALPPLLEELMKLQ